jgi:MYXO-CTERM domain-containing protein
VWNDDPLPDVKWWLNSKIDVAKSLQAVPVFTCYLLLQLGQARGLTGSEPEVVQKVLQSPALMKEYFEKFVFLLQTAEQSGTPVLMHVEPDSWGFMMWAMGVEGNADATSVAVSVGSSGHPDVAAFPNHAGGFGQALLKLRDQHAPSARMGWHASNFRTGTRPDVVTGMYASMGDWDVLVTEEPHLEANEAEWWLPWDEAKLQTNLDWFFAVSQQSKLPVLMWQSQIGTVDWHLFTGGPAMLERFAKAGLGAVMFDLRGSGNPDDYRAYEIPALATVPPSDSEAGGTAKEMRARLAQYTKNPLAWPAGAPCAPGGGGSAGAAGGAGAPGSGGNAGSTPGQDAGPGTDAANDSSHAADGASSSPLSSGGAGDGGCGCRTSPSSSPPAVGLLIALAALTLRRARKR